MVNVVEIPLELTRFQLPVGVQQRLNFLLDRQDVGETLTTAEFSEAEGLVELAEFLSLLQLRSHSPTQLECPRFPLLFARSVIKRSGDRCKYCTLSQAGQFVQKKLSSIAIRRSEIDFMASCRSIARIY